MLLLGSTGYHPNAHRHTACFLFPELGLVFDAGTGLFRLREHLASDDLDIFLTHAHLDHIMGLTFLLDQLHGRDMDSVTIHGRPKDLAAIQEHLLAEELFPVKLPYTYKPLSPHGTMVTGSGRLMHFPLVHPGGSVGYRVDWPHASFAYVTDTVANPSADYVKLIHGVDVLIHECYFPDTQAEWAEKTGHSWTTPVAQVAKQADVGRLILVHVDPLNESDDPIGIDVARKIFPKTEVGFDLMEVKV
jgi:ribonuclease BN (tRNA processing enzyme)